MHRILLGLLLCFTGSLASAQVNGFYRFPTLRGDTVWFTAEGDLWRVGTAGGAAQRITTHPAAETRPAVSPDGRWLAFTGAYEGPTEAYVMAVDGGVPKRLTWGGQNVLVMGWTPAGEVLVTAPAENGQPDTQLYAITPATLARRTLPVGQASDGALGPDAKTLYFVRSGLRGDNVRAYRGGAMAQLWSLALDSNAEARPLVNAQENARRPMPYVNAQGEARVAFLSDRDGSFNLWSVNVQGLDPRQHTRHAGWDIRHASIDGTRVVYALGADLRLIDLDTDADRLLSISLGGDFDQLRTRWVKSPQPYLSTVHLSPNGERVALTVRGRVATQGVAALRRAELAVPAGARCRDATFGRDSAEVFALCDIGGEVEVWRFKANGSGTPLQITHGASLLRAALFPSPDGKWLAHFDIAGRLTLTALTAAGGGASSVIDTPRANVDPTLAWSPDSRAIAFARPAAAGPRAQLMLYTIADATLHVLSSDRYDSSSPTFTPDSKWLYFLSDRSFMSLNRSPWGDRNMGPYFDRRTKVYALALQPGLRFPFQPHDELEPVGPRPEPGPTTTVTAVVGAPAGAASASVTVQSKPTPPAAKPTGPLPAIQTDGLAQRLFEVPLAAGNYELVGTDGKRLYLLEADSTPERRTGLRTLAIENTAPQPELFAPEIKGFEITPDGKKLMLARSAGTGTDTGDILIVDTGAKLPSDVSKNKVNWADWQIAIDPRAEWRQMFADAWRLHRDYFYDAKMLGIDWPASRRKYEPLLARVTDRNELNELLAQMVAELHTLHSQVLTRDLREGPEEIAAAGLGARFAKIAEGFRVEQVYRSDPELPSEAAPLAQARVVSGDVITAVNGRPTRELADLSELLRGQVGRQMLLTLQRRDVSGAVSKTAGKPAEKTADKPREVIVTPVNAARERQLAAGDWEAGRAEQVQAAGKDRIGYLRLRAMGPGDIATFAREFYANVERDALIIDVRGNNGGSIDSWVLEKLMRRAWAFWQRRSPDGARPYPNMQAAFRGHLAVLIDQNTYSDGETFAEGVKRLQLGALIGKRTAGAGVWLSDRNRLADNGLMRAAETAQFALDGSWLVEGKGVTPDIEVDNPPRASFGGGDAQLDAAIVHLQRRLIEQPIPVPVAPPR